MNLNTPLRVLLVEDSEKDAMLVLEALRQGGYEPIFTRVQTAETMQAALAGSDWEIVLSDFAMPAFDAPRALTVLQKSGRDIPFIIVSGTIGEDTAVAAMKQGATDYLLKDRLARLGPSVRQALELARSRRERRQAEAALMGSQRQIADIVNTVDGIVWEADAQTFKFTFVSEQAERMLGYPAARWVNESGFWAEHIHPEDRQAAVEFCVIATKKMQPHQFEYRMLAADGRVVWLKDLVVVLVEGGRPVKLRGIMVDVTERKQAEAALKLNEFSVHNASAPTYWIARDARILRVNRAACDLLGYTEAELLAMAITDLDPDFPPGRWPQHWEELREKKRMCFETKHRRKDGRIFPVEVDLNWFEFEGREYNFAFARDITERKQAEEALVVERTLLRTLFDLLPDFMYVKDTQGRFITCNDRCARGMGAASAEELIGKTDADYYPAEMAAGFRADELTVLAGTAVIDKEEKITQGGVPQVILTNKLPFRDSAGKIIGIVGNGRDITHRLQLEEQLRQSQKMEAIGQLSGGVAHDFNNLLTVIKGHIGLLHAKDQVPPEIADSIQQIDEAADRAANLTRQLLTFSRQQVMQTADLNLNGVVFNLTKMLRRLLSESIEMEVVCAKQPLPIRADEGMVEQVLLNLVVNARDAMAKTGSLHITTEAVDLDETTARAMRQGRPGNFVCVSVSDTGSGIAPEVLPRIFEPFFTTKGIGKGTGLGLATVYGIIQQHEGWINVESVVGLGTTFRAYFPRLNSTFTESMAEQGGPPVDGGHEGILLVEDESAVREVAEAALTSLGYKVFAAPSGLAALQVWEMHRHEIDLLLTDLVMPDGITGRDLAVRLRGSVPKLPVIYMSGYSHEVAGGDFVLQEGTNYLPKPFDLANLARLVRASLDRGASTPPFARRSG